MPTLELTLEQQYWIYRIAKDLKATPTYDHDNSSSI
jgi:hypothetical protein